MRFTFHASLLATTALTTLLPSIAFAQAVPEAGTTVLSPIVVDTSKATAARPRAGVPAAQSSSQPAAAGGAQPGALDALSTSSEKTAASLYDAPGAVSVKSAAELERQTINSPRQLVRDEPGVEFANQPTRAGGTNFNIRGIDGNRVRVEIDGVKVPDFPGTNIGSPTGYSRDFVDLDTLKRVEIIRGPASALYGSDAIGGVVAFLTKDPADYLALVNKDWFMSVKGGFDTQDKSVFTTVTGANRLGNVDSMLVVTRRWGHEVTPNGSMAANPQSFQTTNTLAKIVYNTGGGGQITLTGETLNRNVDTDIRTERTATVLGSYGDDNNQRTRLSLDWNAPVNLWFADSIRTKVYGTQVNREEISDQNRLSAGMPRFRHSDFSFEQTIYGGEIQLTAKRHAFGGSHLLTYGVSYDDTGTTRPRERTETNLTTGVSTTVFPATGDIFPNKNFPDTRTTMASAYVQDIAQWGALRVIPAVRFDMYNLTVSPDAWFANSNTSGFKVTDQSATAISPKLGVTYDLTQQLRLFGQYARGFRAPPYDNANFGFTNAANGYEILPNGNLSPETSDGFEVGLRGRNATGSSFQVSGFYNKYQNFIETVSLGVSPTSGLLQFQYRNLSNVTIYGAEAKGEWRFMPTWSLFGTLAYAVGTNDDTQTPIDSVNPLKVVSGFRYYGTNGWSGEIRTTMVAEKDRVSTPGFLIVPGHTTVDGLIGYQVAPSMTVNVGVFNIFNASYFNPADVAGLSSTSSLLELYRAPGRTASMNVTFRW